MKGKNNITGINADKRRIDTSQVNQEQETQA